MDDDLRQSLLNDAEKLDIEQLRERYVENFLLIHEMRSKATVLSLSIQRSQTLIQEAIEACPGNPRQRTVLVQTLARVQSLYVETLGHCRGQLTAIPKELEEML